MKKETSTIIKKDGRLFFIVLTTLIALVSCGKKENPFMFKTAEQALYTCHQELNSVRQEKDPSVENVGRLSREWLTLQDSCYSVFLRDTTFDSTGEMAVDFVMVSDSIRETITDLALSQPRTLDDVIELKFQTAYKRQKVTTSEDYKIVERFYRGLDGRPVYKTASQTIILYNKFLDTSILSKDEDLLQKFLAEEDLLFRSLMAHLSEISDQELQLITDKTLKVFKVVDDKFMGTWDGEMNRMVIYLTMRYNRRIIQNALACREDIRQKKKLPENIRANYMWMLMQPMISIDNNSMAVLTEEEIYTLKNLTKELPRLMLMLDSEDDSVITSEDLKKTMEMMANYFLKAHLKSTL